MCDKCKFEETIDEETGSIHIVNEYGCDWCDGVGFSPEGEFCGECDCITNKKCLAREGFYEHRNL